MAPLIVSRRVDDDGLQAWAAELGASDSNIVEVWLYELVSEKVVTFKGYVFNALVQENIERTELARLKAKYEPAAAVVGGPGPVRVVWPDSASGGYVVPSGETPYEVAGKVNADPDAPFTAVVVDGAVRLHQVARGASSLVVSPEDAPGVKFYEPTPAGVASLASMARQVRPSLSGVSCLAVLRIEAPGGTCAEFEDVLAACGKDAPR